MVVMQHSRIRKQLFSKVRDLLHMIVFYCEPESIDILLNSIDVCLQSRPPGLVLPPFVFADGRGVVAAAVPH